MLEVTTGLHSQAVSSMLLARSSMPGSGYVRDHPRGNTKVRSRARIGAKFRARAQGALAGRPGSARHGPVRPRTMCRRTRVRRRARSLMRPLPTRPLRHTQGRRPARVTLSPTLLPQCAAGKKEKGEGASRLCRCRPSLSNQSNRWGQTWRQQAFHRSGFAQMPPTGPDPEVNI